MAFYSYSPWKDAAEFGGGVGRTLSQALIQRPEIQAQAALMRQRMQQEQQEQPLDLEYKKAQIRNLDYRPEYMGQLMQARIEAQNEKERHNQETEGWGQERNRIYDLLTQSMIGKNEAQTQKLEEPKAPTTETLSRLLLDRMKELGAEDGGPPVPTSPDMESKKFVLDSKSVDEGLDRLGSMERLPNTVTNRVPTKFGFGTPKDVVTTNSFTAKIPHELIDNFGVEHSGQVPNASLPVPHGAPQQQALPQMGEVRKGYKYLGGDPAKPESWVQVQ